MANKHDRVIKDLINNREFAISWLQQYLDKKLVSLVDWNSVVINSANVEHSRQSHKQNIKTKEQSDIAFTFKFKSGEDGAIFVHMEQQVTNDETLLIRVKHYQTSYLLDFIKQNKGVKKLPLIVSIIYYANKKPFTHSLDINDYFQNSALAKEYAFTTKFIDLNRMSDEEIKSHGYISAYELVLKYIRENKIDDNLKILIKHMVNCDLTYRLVLLKYIGDCTYLSNEEFKTKVIECENKLENDMNTVAEQWKQEGYGKGYDDGIVTGIEKGIERGGLEAKKETAKNMLAKRYNINDIMELTGLEKSVICSLETQH